MKTIIYFATLICLAVSVPAIEESSVKNDIADFLEIIPVEKIKKIAIQHLHDDPGFQAAVKYMMGDEFVNMVQELQKQPEVIELKQFLKTAGVDLEEYGMKFCSFFRDVKIQTDYKEKSLKSFIDDVKQIIPMTKLIQAFDQKMNTSPVFKEFYDKITSEETHQLVAKVRALAVFKNIVAELTAMGIDINRIFTVAYAVFGWADEANTPKP